MPVRRKLARDPPRELVRLGRVRSSVATVDIVPLLLERCAARDDLGVGPPDRFRNDEPLFRVEAELLLDVGDLLVSKSLTVRGTGILLPRAEADCRADDDERRRAGVLAGLLQCVRDGRDFARSVFLILGSSGIDDVPACRLEPERDVFGEAVVDRAVDSDLWKGASTIDDATSTLISAAHLVAIIHQDEVIQSEVPCDGDSCK